MQARTQSIPRPEVPEQIKAPASEEVVLMVHASGSQIYVCQQASEGKSAWVLKAPEAELRDDAGNVIGKHSAGPTWKLNDGSEISGKASAKVEAPEPGSIPWLLINVTGHSGSGSLSKVSSVQRIHTRGGQPPAGACDAGANTEKKVSYTADYYFFAPAK